MIFFLLNFIFYFCLIQADVVCKLDERMRTTVFKFTDHQVGGYNMHAREFSLRLPTVIPRLPVSHKSQSPQFVLQSPIPFFFFTQCIARPSTHARAPVHVLYISKVVNSLLLLVWRGRECVHCRSLSYCIYTSLPLHLAQYLW